MKKILSYILISLIIATNLLAPISVGWDKNNLEVKSNKAEAVPFIGNSDQAITVNIKASSKDSVIQITVDVNWEKTSWLTHDKRAVVVKKRDGTQYGEMQIVPLKQRDPLPGETLDATKQTGFVEFTGLTPGTTYQFDVVASQDSMNILQGWANIVTWTYRKLSMDEIPIVGHLFEYNNSNGVVQNDPNSPYEVTTLTDVSTTYIPQELQNPTMTNEAATLPICTLSSWTVGGCVGVFLYRAVFQPSAYLFAITGKLLDYTLFYSIQDTSYRSQFVVEGWGIVRDFCNMFFIFVLLYIAFKTILGLSVSKTKEMVINVVIIGLLINFSLFATQVIIDASNILTRVFYNQIVVGPKVNNVVVEELGLGGSKQLTAALIAKINPQKIIISAGEASKIATKGATTINTTTDTTKGQVDSGTFIMVTIMASIMNIVGLWTFLMVSMVFIARVVGLWLAMILVPVAFFSYTIPQMQEVDMIGWKKWWPETLKMAFLAPVFLFFLYIIIQFLSSGLGVMNADGKSGVDFFIAIIVPFAFLMILLIKAKDITTKMAGKIGETITNAAKTVGGVALGAGLGAGAMAMRGTVGRLAENMSEKQGFKDWAAKSRFGGSMLKATRGVASGSFDARGVKVFGKDLSSTGLKVGKSGGTGGFTKGRKDWTENQEKFASSLNMSEKERYDRGLTFTGAPGEDRTATQAQIDAVNTERRLTRAKTVDGSTTSRNIASTKIREASINRNKKLQDALIAAAGGGTPATPPTPPTPPHP